MMKNAKGQWWVIGGILMQSITVGFCFAVCFHAITFFFAMYPDTRIPDMVLFFSFLVNFDTSRWSISPGLVCLGVSVFCALLCYSVTMTAKGVIRRLLRLWIVSTFVWCALAVFVAWMTTCFIAASVNFGGRPYVHDVNEKHLPESKNLIPLDP